MGRFLEILQSCKLIASTNHQSIMASSNALRESLISGQARRPSLAPCRVYDRCELSLCFGMYVVIFVDHVEYILIKLTFLVRFRIVYVFN